MDEIIGKFFSKADDFDGFVGAFIDADATADTKVFADYGFMVLAHYDGFVSGADAGAVFDTFL